MNRYTPDRVLHKDQCTLQDCIRLFNSVLKIFSVYTDIVLSEHVQIWRAAIPGDPKMYS